MAAVWVEELGGKVRPCRDRVLVRKDAVAKQSKGGVVLPDIAQVKTEKGVVLACGPGKTDDNGVLRTPAVKSGDRVLFGPFAGDPVDRMHEEIVLMREEDIFAVEEP
jgi:chaperonin GroES